MVTTVILPLILILLIAAADRQISTLLNPPQWIEPVHYAFVLVAAVVAIYVVRAVVRELGDILDDRLGLARARSLTTIVSIILYTVVILVSIDVAGFNLSGFLLSGALVGVVVGIAGQASLSNMVAGLVILFARPYVAGLYVTARTGSFGGVEYSGQVWDISLFYTTLHINELEVRIPNSAMIGAVVVMRPAQYDLSIPVTLRHALVGDPAPWLDLLRERIAACTPDHHVPRVTLDGVSDVGYLVGVRAFVANDDERHAVERIVTELLQADVLAETTGLETEAGAAEVASG